MQRDHLEPRPAPDLQPYVRRLLPYDLRVPARTRQLEPPGPGVVLIFGVGPGLGLVDQADPERRPTPLGSFVAGPHDARTVLEYDGNVRGVEVDLTPLATRMLFRVPMRFREHVGLPPKLIARLFRFQNATGRLSSPESSIAEIATACGYYDQAHLDRDFRDFVGTTPSDFAASMPALVTAG